MTDELPFNNADKKKFFQSNAERVFQLDGRGGEVTK